MQLAGTLKVIKEEQKVSDKFKKREFILTDNSSQYPQYISFQLTQDKCSLLDQYSVGDMVNIHFNIRGREWTSPQGEIKYFNTLEAWKIDGNAKGQPRGQAMESTQDISSPQVNDDLPF